MNQYSESLQDWAELHGEVIPVDLDAPEYCHRHPTVVVPPLSIDGCDECNRPPTDAERRARRYAEELERVAQRDALYDALMTQAMERP